MSSKNILRAITMGVLTIRLVVISATLLSTVIIGEGIDTEATIRALIGAFFDVTSAVLLYFYLIELTGKAVCGLVASFLYGCWPFQFDFLFGFGEIVAPWPSLNLSLLLAMGICSSRWIRDPLQVRGVIRGGIFLSSIALSLSTPLIGIGGLMGGALLLCRLLQYPAQCRASLGLLSVIYVLWGLVSLPSWVTAFDSFNSWTECNLWAGVGGIVCAWGLRGIIVQKGTVRSLHVISFFSGLYLAACMGSQMANVLFWILCPIPLYYEFYLYLERRKLFRLL